MDPIRPNYYHPQQLQTGQVQQQGLAGSNPNYAQVQQPHQHLPSGPHVNPHAMASKVAVGGDAFFTGILKSRLDASQRAYLRSALSPDFNTPVTQPDDGMFSYLVHHQNEHGHQEVLAVTVDVDRNKYLRGIIATREHDQQVMMQARFESKINHFSTKLSQGIRSKIAERVQDTMLAKGPKWYTELASGEQVTMKKLSVQNMRELKEKVRLDTLRDYEKDFIKSIIDEPLYLTHATPSDSNVKGPDGIVGLLSRKTLSKRGTDFNTENTSEQDIDMLASDDHVFFSLEAGSEPQKDSSRFGDKMFRFAFDQPKILQIATLHLVDPLTAIPPSADTRFDAIDNHDDPDVAAQVIDSLNERAYVPAEGTFHGPHMKLGLALSIIQTCRQHMPEEMGKDILRTASVNNVINGLLRPTVMVPKHFFDKPTDESDILIN